MDKDFMQYVYKRCEAALIKNKEYTDLQKRIIEARENKKYELEDELNDMIDARAEELCYLQGYSDAMRLILNLNERDSQ